MFSAQEVCVFSFAPFVSGGVFIATGAFVSFAVRAKCAQKQVCLQIFATLRFKADAGRACRRLQGR